MTSLPSPPENDSGEADLPIPGVNLDIPPAPMISLAPGSTLTAPLPPPSALVVAVRRVPDLAVVLMLAWWGKTGVVTPHEAWLMAMGVLALRVRPATPGALARFFVR